MNSYLDKRYAMLGAFVVGCVCVSKPWKDWKNKMTDQKLRIEVEPESKLTTAKNTVVNAATDTKNAAIKVASTAKDTVVNAADTVKNTAVQTVSKVKEVAANKGAGLVGAGYVKSVEAKIAVSKASEVVKETTVKAAGTVKDVSVKTAIGAKDIAIQGVSKSKEVVKGLWGKLSKKKEVSNKPDEEEK